MAFLATTKSLTDITFRKLLLFYRLDFKKSYISRVTLIGSDFFPTYCNISTEIIPLGELILTTSVDVSANKINTYLAWKIQEIFLTHHLESINLQDAMPFKILQKYRNIV